ncbi:uncharacterized calcium-binding protein At1g02270 isoform X1 [Arachis ipaensis]|uniref:uncharacterized calcium-binding protein At1g02270 isoform X1 n=1 Tax=Arachis ipaensis TaxID=130454 RepID=UPI0007AEF31C|nr:uncharacterized calcium-binding protein At1g02270 isoform X1 [Arachis ipaensis]XP_025631884.1 uncharacterized calcium-binding protein At1g02270 isoform X1 [Arachis hypogaea]QHO22655.1 putative calcium-binding protein [Arachis hypogaea]
MVVAAGSSVAKLNLRKGKGSSYNVMSGGDNSDGDLSIVSNNSDSECCSSSMVEVERGPSCVSFTTFNILAPIYKRIDPKNQSLRESEFRYSWLSRNESILNSLLAESSSIMCLQEFWVGNEELVHMYEEKLGDAGYHLFKLARTNNRGDGLLTAIHTKYLHVVNYRELFLNDFGDRVAQLLHVQSIAPVSQNQMGSLYQEFLIVNTHLLFPHDSSLCIVRLHQVHQILQHVELFQKENRLKPMPIILCGDWNGSKKGHVYKFLRSQGFVSSYDCYADSHKQWVSHRNHRGNICGVDFIWLCNPNQPRKPLKTSWAEAVFSILKYQLRKASLSEDSAFTFLKGDNCADAVTYLSFHEALRQVKLVDVPNGLCIQQFQDLWNQADVDGNGVIDLEEFKQKIWNSTCPEPVLESFNGCMEDVNATNEHETIGFKVKTAMLFPREVERGHWPEEYSLSDHARLTAVFSPAKMRCYGSQKL